MKISTVVLAVLATLFLTVAHARAADLVVTVKGITQDTDTIRVVLLADPDGVAHQKASRNLDAAQSVNGELTTRFLGLAPARFGVVAIEDRKVNHALEKAFTGTVAAPRATSVETKVDLAEPNTTVILQLTPPR